MKEVFECGIKHCSKWDSVCTTSLTSIRLLGGMKCCYEFHDVIVTSDRRDLYSRMEIIKMKYKGHFPGSSQVLMLFFKKK